MLCRLVQTQGRFGRKPWLRFQSQECDLRIVASIFPLNLVYYFTLKMEVATSIETFGELQGSKCYKIDKSE
jgi:hypothetical protein